MTTTDPAKALAREIQELRRQISAISRGSQASRRSLQINGETVTIPQIAGLGQAANDTAAAAKVDAEAARLAAQVATQDAQAAATKADDAEAAALEAAGIAASKGKIVYTVSEPEHDPNILWIKPPLNVPQRWDGDSWENVQDQTVASAQDAADQALAAAADAQASADGKVRTYFADTAPTGLTLADEGDLWFETDNGNKLSRWSGTAWVAATLGASAIAATARQLGAITTFYVGTAPTTGMVAGDLWVNTTNGQLSRYSTQWDLVQDSAIAAAAKAAADADKKAADAATAAQQAQNTASAASGTATSAFTTAQGKNTVTYSTVAPVTATNPGIRAGDIWFMRQVTGVTAGVIQGTWEWNGSAWLSRVFGDEVLNSLTVGKLTAGTMTADVTLAGRFSTAPTGARREMNSVGFQAFDASNTLTISLDGVNNLLTGKLRTALTGRRIEIAAGSNLSQIDLWADDPANRTFIRSFTEPDGKEAIQIGYGDPTQNGLDGRLNINTAGWFTSRFTRTDFVVGASWNLFGAAYDAGQNWMSYTAASKLLNWNNIGDQNTWQTGNNYHEANNFQWKVRPAAGADVDLQFSHAGRLSVRYGVDAYFGGWWEFIEASQAYTASPKLALFTNEGFGAYIRFNGSTTWQDLEFKYFDDSFFVNLQARAYIVQSDAAAKEDITAATDVDYLADVCKTKVKRYRRTAVDKKGNVLTGDAEVGLIAQEAPAQIVRGQEGSLGIDMYQMNTYLWGAVQQLSARLDALDHGGPKPPKQ